MEKLISALIIALVAFSAPATTIYVDANGTGDYPTIQAAINAASGGDVIILQPGTYIGDGNRDIDFLGKAITVRSTNPDDPCIVDATIIDCEHSGQGFVFDSEEGPGSVLAGLTITNGEAGTGGGIYCYASSPTVSNCILIYNLAGGLGGGMYIENANMIIIGCAFISNDAIEGAGGGILNQSSDLEIVNCIFGSNYRNGVTNISGGTVNIINCIFTDNWGYVGLYNADMDHVNVTNCTFNGNGDEYNGVGHAIINVNSSANVTNCILWESEGDELYGTGFTVSYSCIQGGYPGTGNIDTDPCFADVYAGDFHLKSQAGRWNPNTETWVVDSNTSPCIDAGNPGCPPGAEPDPNGNRINMGAYGGTAYASKSPDNFRSLSDMDNNWVVDLDDLAIFAGYWLDSGTCVPSDLDRSGAVDFKDYAVFTYDPCSQASAYEPNIVYTIEDCDMGLITPDSDSNDLRFTVTVDGQYILFEDMMVANCCPDELELQMAVEDNFITIYEVEYLSTPCYCICDYPVSAILGPFTPGTYTLEVYEHFGGFIGRTTATIP
jgi:hypothetical protein